MIDHLDEDALAERIAGKVLERLRAALPDTPLERLVTKAELAKALSVSQVQVDRFAREGMPRVYLGDRVPRFEIGACRRWLTEHRAKAPAPASTPALPTATRLSRPQHRRVG